mmetsp:Transcript_29197/g.62066  ORF Transcript_29197/g.62066 Transcript_29197/m.62066 type:complete len:205 (+) Transcript_29197:1141-1755(+)
MVQGGKVCSPLDVTLVRLHNQQEMLLDERLLRQEVRHRLLLLVRLDGHQGLDASHTQGNVQGVEHLRPLESSFAINQQPCLQLVEDNPGDVAQTLCGSGLVQKATSADVALDLLEPLLYNLSHARQDASTENVLGGTSPSILQQSEAFRLHRAPPAHVEVLLLPFIIRLLYEERQPGLPLLLRLRRNLLRTDLFQQRERTRLVL